MADSESPQAVTRRHESSPWWPLLFWVAPVCALALLALAPIEALQAVVIFNFNTTTNDLRFVLVQLATGCCAVAVPVVMTLLAIDVAWGPGPFWKRFVIGWSAGLAAFACWVSGLAIRPHVAGLFLDPKIQNVSDLHEREFDQRAMVEFAQILSTLSVMFIGLQAPFFLLRIVRGYRLHLSSMSQGQPPGDLSRESMAIRDLLIATAVIAACLGALNGSYQPREGENPYDFDTERMSMILGSLMGGVAVAVLALVCVVPAAWYFLKGRRKSLGWLVALGLGATGSVFGCCWATIVDSHEAWRAATAIMAYLFEYAFGVCLGLMILRVYGWELASSKASRSTTLPSTPRNL